MDFLKCKKVVSKLNSEKLKNVFMKSFKYLKSYEPLLREFENVELIFELEISASCFAQMKRHRMATILTQPYNPNLGYVLPDSIKSTGLEKDFLSVINDTQTFYFDLYKSSPLAAEYILPNAVKRRILMKVNLRELTHIARLREDFHAQWEIRNVAKEMVSQAKQVAPLSLMLACGKDAFGDIKEKIFRKE